MRQLEQVVVGGRGVLLPADGLPRRPAAAAPARSLEHCAPYCRSRSNPMTMAAAFAYQ